MRIGEVAQRAGIAASTLRYYEAIGLLAPPARDANGHRIYDDDIFQRLAVIQWCKATGFTLDEIRALPSDEWRTMARQKLQAVEQTIQHYQVMRQTLQAGINCTCTSLSNCALLP